MSVTLDRERLVDAMVDDYDTADQINDVRAHVRHLLDAALPMVVDRVELDELPPHSVLLTAHLQVVQTVRSCGGHRLVVGLDGTAPEITGAAFPMTVLSLP